jgi:hypothetical protein
LQIFEKIMEPRQLSVVTRVHTDDKGMWFQFLAGAELFLFFAASTLTVGSTQFPLWGVLGTFCPGLEADCFLSQILKLNGAVPPLSHISLGCGASLSQGHFSVLCGLVNCSEVL